MSAKDYDDVVDDWMRYAKTINDRKRRAEQHDRTARADDGEDDDDPYGDPPEKSARPECPTFEVSALEADNAFMKLRSGKRKYQAPLPVVAPTPVPVAPAQPGPPPDTTHADPKHVAVRLDDNGLPGPSSYEPSCFEDPEFFYDSDARYEDQ
jgi:hypothetical protein